MCIPKSTDCPDLYQNSRFMLADEDTDGNDAARGYPE
jgi:hypothetical protein